MDSYYRDTARSPADRGWGREDPRNKIDRDDNFYRGRSPGALPTFFVYHGGYLQGRPSGYVGKVCRDGLSCS